MKKDLFNDLLDWIQDQRETTSAILDDPMDHDQYSRAKGMNNVLDALQEFICEPSDNSDMLQFIVSTDYAPYSFFRVNASSHYIDRTINVHCFYRDGCCWLTLPTDHFVVYMQHDVGLYDDMPFKD